MIGNAKMEGGVLKMTIYHHIMRNVNVQMNMKESIVK